MSTLTNEHLAMIRYIAWSFHKTTGHDFDDIFSEACLLYCEAKEKYNGTDGRAKFSTFAYSVIRNRLIDYLRKQRPTISIEDEQDEPATTPDYEYYNNFPSDVKTIITTALKFSEEKPTKVVAWATKDSLKKRGWTMKRIKAGIGSLKFILNHTEVGRIII